MKLRSCWIKWQSEKMAKSKREKKGSEGTKKRLIPLS